MKNPNSTFNLPDSSANTLPAIASMYPIALSMAATFDSRTGRALRRWKATASKSQSDSTAGTWLASLPVQ